MAKIKLFNSLMISQESRIRALDCLSNTVSEIAEEQ